MIERMLFTALSLMIALCALWALQSAARAIWRASVRRAGRAHVKRLEDAQAEMVHLRQQLRARGVGVR